MSPTAASVMESALSLSDVDRAAIADALLSSLPEESEEFAELSDEEFARELQRRSDEMKNDPTASIPWSQLRKMT
jgi:putative addiction module component (TIGR02574 family)